MSGRRRKSFLSLRTVALPHFIWQASTVRQGDTREFVILTREPVSLVAEIHNRMPVVFPRDQAEAWLYDTNAALELIRTVPPELVRALSKIARRLDLFL